MSVFDRTQKQKASSVFEKEQVPPRASRSPLLMTVFFKRKSEQGGEECGGEPGRAERSSAPDNGPRSRGVTLLCAPSPGDRVSSLGDNGRSVGLG